MMPLSAITAWTPAATTVARPHKNGVMDSRNRHLKTAIDQALILRGSLLLCIRRDFACVADYRRFVDMAVARAQQAAGGCRSGRTDVFEAFATAAHHRT